ncbi:MAG TPA: cysteine synthase family protein [Candidatus Dependentiae bacterium]|jgi:cystathionine beta-synthase|nr:cysteine synthase family protein [Candidatus Dependentiae bacterium]
MVYNHILDAIGNTPIVKVPFDCPGSIYAKLEYLNIGGSVKDRSALFMIEQAEKNGKLKPGGTIIDASSGNQGIATAMIGAIKGYKVIITVPAKTSKEKCDTIKAYGAEIVVCPTKANLQDPDSYHSKAKAIHAATPNSFMPNQYFNTDNAMAHYSSTGPEIWKQTEGKITHFFAGAGTCGTVSGTGRYLKEQNPAIKVLAIDSSTSFRSTKGNPSPYKYEGIGVDFTSPVLDESVVDEFLTVSDADGLGYLKTLASKYGFLAGLASGAVAWATQQYAKKYMKEGDLGVMIFGDSGRAYLTKGYYNTDSEYCCNQQVHTTPEIKQL